MSIFQTGLKMWDVARISGIPVDQLRWRMGAGVPLAIFDACVSITTPVSLVPAKHEPIKLDGDLTFCGITAFVDTSLPADELRLERVIPLERVTVPVPIAA